MIALVAGLIIAAVVMCGVKHARVPNLRGLTKTAAARKAHRAHLKTAFDVRFSTEKRGVAIAQTPSRRSKASR